MQHSDLISTTEAAEILGLTRSHVFRLAQSGKIPAVKIGRNFAIKKSDLGIYGGELSKQEKKNIEESVDRVLKEYGDVIKKLGEE
jgi:excisionase family DNA binding protein